MPYNYLEDNFTSYENVENPAPTLLYQNSLMNDAVDLTGKFYKVTEGGTPIAVDTFQTAPKMTMNNTEEQSIQPISNNSSLNVNIKGRPKQAVEFFKSKGLSTHAAAAIVGNLMLESGDITLNKTDNIGDKHLGPKGSSYGMGQWRLDRRTALTNFAAKRGKPISDFETQLEFVWDEINNSQKAYKVLEGLNNAKTVEEATESFMKTYERPNKNPKINALATRIKYAKSLLS